MKKIICIISLSCCSYWEHQSGPRQRHLLLEGTCRDSTQYCFKLIITWDAELIFLSCNLVSSDLSIWLLEKSPLLLGKQFQTGLISHEMNASYLPHLNMHLMVYIWGDIDSFPNSADTLHRETHWHLALPSLHSTITSSFSLYPSRISDLYPDYTSKLFILTPFRDEGLWQMQVNDHCSFIADFILF